MTKRVRWQVSDSNIETDECTSDSRSACVRASVCVCVASLIHFSVVLLIKFDDSPRGETEHCPRQRESEAGVTHSRSVAYFCRVPDSQLIHHDLINSSTAVQSEVSSAQLSWFRNVDLSSARVSWRQMTATCRAAAIECFGNR